VAVAVTRPREGVQFDVQDIKHVLPQPIAEPFAEPISVTFAESVEQGLLNASEE
jgi:hypothetical protein